MFNSSEQTTEIIAAIAQAQGDFKPFERSKKVNVQTKGGQHYSFFYAPIDAILKAVGPALSAAGVAILQPAGFEAGSVVVTTMLWHKSGQFISSTVSWPFSDNRIQELGSIVTYLRRYSLSSMLSLAADEDIDGPPSAHGSDSKGDIMPDKKKVDTAVRSRLLSLKKEWMTTIPGLSQLSQSERAEKFSAWCVDVLGDGKWDSESSWSVSLIDQALETIAKQRGGNAQ